MPQSHRPGTLVPEDAAALLRRSDFRIAVGVALKLLPLPVGIFTLQAADAGSGVTELTVTMDGHAMAVPVIRTMTAGGLAVSWLSDNVPSGDWTATLERRPAGGFWSAVATFSVSTS